MSDHNMEQNFLFKECDAFKQELLSTVAKSLREVIESNPSAENGLSKLSPGKLSIINNQQEAAFNLLAAEHYARMLDYLKRMKKTEAEIVNQNTETLDPDLASQLNLKPVVSVNKSENPTELDDHPTKRFQQEDEKTIAIIAKKPRRRGRAGHWLNIQAKPFTGEPYHIIVDIRYHQSLIDYVKKRDWECPVKNCNVGKVRFTTDSCNRDIINDHLFLSRHDSAADGWCCRECDGTFANVAILCSHYMSLHMKGPFSCGWPGCTSIEPYRGYIFDHLKSDHDTSRETCPECKEEFNDSQPPSSQVAHECRTESTWACLWISSSDGDGASPSICGFQDPSCSRAMKHVMDDHLVRLERPEISPFYYLNYIHRSDI